MTNGYVYAGLVTVAVAFASAQQVSAVPTYDLDVEYVGSVTGDKTSDLGILDLSITQSATHLHKFDVRLAVTNAAAGEDLRQLVSRFNFGIGLSFDSYVAANPLIDHDGDASTAQVTPFTANAVNQPVIDGFGVRQSNANRGVANLLQIGEAGRPNDSLGFPSLLGTLFLRWDGLQETAFVLDFRPDASSYFTGNQNGAGTIQLFPTSQPGSGDAFIFGANVPEPATLMVIACGLSLLTMRRRAQTS